MAIDLTTGASGFFLRGAELFGGINESNTFAASTIVTRADTIANDFLTAATQRRVIGDLDNQALNVRSDLSDWSAYLTQLVNDMLVAMCIDDTALPVSTSVTDIFVKLNRDMVAKPASFMRPTVTGTVAAGTQVGDGYLITSVIDPIDGHYCYYANSEVVRLSCTADSYSGGATAGSETFSIDSEASVDRSDSVWPKGSGISSSITAVSRSTDAILTDGALELWGSTGNNTPTDWSLKGTAGTNITRGSSSPYEGSYFCTLTGDAATTVGIYQNIVSNITANKNYAVQFWYKVPASLTTTRLQISLMDGSEAIISDNSTGPTGTVTGATNATPIVITTSNHGLNTGDSITVASVGGNTNANGTWVVTRVSSSTFSLDGSAGNSAYTSGGTWVWSASQASVIATATLNAATSWTRFACVLRTPRNLATEVRLDIRCITAVLQNAKTILIDAITMAECEQLYPGGPYHALIAGATPFAVLDSFTNTIVNAGTTATFVRNLDRAFGLAENGIRLRTLTVAASGVNPYDDANIA